MNSNRVKKYTNYFARIYPIYFLAKLIYLIRYWFVLMFSFNNFESQIKFANRSLFEQVIFVRVDDVKWGTNQPKKFGKIMNSNKGFVSKGDWDIDYKAPIDQYIKKHRSCKTITQLFINNLDYKETDQYLRMREKISSGLSSKGSHSFMDIDRYFKDLLNAYHDIKLNGYKDHKILGNSMSKEVNVYIDRQGDLIIGSEGNHRLMIAKILNIDSIPVVVKGVHYEWASKCFEKYSGSLRQAISRGLNDISVDEKGGN